MHELLKQNQVSAYKADDRALFQKSMEDASLNGLIVNLAEKSEKVMLMVFVKSLIN